MPIRMWYLGWTTLRFIFGMLISAPRGWTQIHFSIFQMVCDLFRPCSHRQAQTSRLPTCSRHPYFLRFSSSETGIRWFDELKFDDPNSSHHRHLPLLPSNRLVSMTSHASTPGLLCYTGSRFGTLPAPVVYHPCPPWKSSGDFNIMNLDEFGWIIQSMLNVETAPESKASRVHVQACVIWWFYAKATSHHCTIWTTCCNVLGSSHESRALSSGWILVVPNYVKNWQNWAMFGITT